MTTALMSSPPTFASLDEVRAAFIMGKLEFHTRSRPWAVFTLPDGSPEGHEQVTVLGVSGVTNTGQPVYRCVRPSGKIEEFDGPHLHTWSQLVYSDPYTRTLSIYGNWFFSQQQERRQRALMRPPEPQDIDVLLDF